MNFGNTKVLFGDNIDHLRNMQSSSINCIITSPPYLDVIDYIKNDKAQINFFFRGNQIKKLKMKSIGNKFNDVKLTQNIFWRKIKRIFAEVYRILKPNSYQIE